MIGSLLGLSQKEIRKKFNSIVEFSELREFVDTKLYQFSRGMLERLAFSIAINCNLDIFLLDEVFAVGDEGFREKSVKEIMRLAKAGASVVLVGHELWMVRDFCDRVIWIDRGKIVCEGSLKKVIGKYLRGAK